MNKKEINELKKNFNEASGLFTLNRVYSAFVDHERNILCKSNRMYTLIPEEEASVIMETLKKVLSGSLGKALTEYEFPRDSYEEGGSQKLLYSLVSGKLEETDESADKLLETIAEKIVYEQAFTLLIGHCSYSVFTKNKNAEIEADINENIYNFVIAAICPVNTGTDGLVFDDETNTIIKKANTEKIISRVPSDGFLYPVFSDRASDVNHVMYYTQSPKKPNISVITEILGCEFLMSCESEKERFHQVVASVAGDELDYNVITRVNEKLMETVELNKDETSLPVIDDNRLKTILSEAGVSDERLEGLSAVYKETVGDAPLTVSNLVETKTVLSMPGITVNIGRDSVDLVRTALVGGKRCLLIDLDDPEITVNGLPAAITQTITSDDKPSDGSDGNT